MTLYEYECRACGAVVERFARLGQADDFIDCPESSCDGRARRLLSRPSAPAFHGSHNQEYRR